MALLYSGGADSSLAACALAKTFKTVHLNTFTRLGFVAPDFSSVHFNRMRERFPDAEFLHRFISAGRFYRALESHRFYSLARRHGWLVLNSCGHCKTALHWRNLVFCLQNGVRFAADGAVVNAEEFAEQNPRILMPELERLYAGFGITLLHPVYQEGLDTEARLFELGISPKERIKMTAHDMQVVCTQQILFAMMMRIILSRHTFTEYEEMARAYLREKLAFIKRLTEDFVAHPGEATAVARML